MLDLREHIYVGPTDSLLAPSYLTLDDLERSQIKVILFDVKYGKNGDSYECPWTSVGMTLRGYGNRHVGINTSPDNWHTCFFLFYLHSGRSCLNWDIVVWKDYIDFELNLRILLYICKSGYISTWMLTKLRFDLYSKNFTKVVIDSFNYKNWAFSRRI